MQAANGGQWRKNNSEVAWENFHVPCQLSMVMPRLYAVTNGEII